MTSKFKFLPVGKRSAGKNRELSMSAGESSKKKVKIKIIYFGS